MTTSFTDQLRDFRNDGNSNLHRAAADRIEALEAALSKGRVIMTTQTWVCPDCRATYASELDRCMAMPAFGFAPCRGVPIEKTRDPVDLAHAEHDLIGLAQQLVDRVADLEAENADLRRRFEGEGGAA